MKRLRITVEGKTYEVTVELPTETSASVASAGVSAPVTSASPVSAGEAVVPRRISPPPSSATGASRNRRP